MKEHLKFVQLFPHHILSLLKWTDSTCQGLSNCRAVIFELWAPLTVTAPGEQVPDLWLNITRHKLKLRWAD